MSIAADLLSGATVALIPLLHATTGLSFWQLLALVFLGSVLDTPGGTSRGALLPDAIARTGTLPVRANTIYEGIGYGAELAGPLTFGLLAALMRTEYLLYVDAATFAVSAVLVALAVPRAIQPAGEQLARTSYLRDVLTGLAYIRRVAVLRTMTTANALTNFAGAPLHTVVLLAYVAEVTGQARDFGLIFAGGAAGLVAGTVVFAAIGHRLPRRAVFVVAFAWFGLPVWLVALQPPVWVIVALFVARGALTAPYNPVQTTVWQERTPAELRGRVFGSSAALALAFLPFGYLLGGLLVEQAGVTATLLVIAAAYALATLWLATRTVLREMRPPIESLEAPARRTAPG
jgi:hypothetical protein